MSDKISLTYFGHSAVLIEARLTKGGVRILLDPFLKGNPLTPEHLQDPDNIDFIGLSHGHSDHVGCCLELARKHSATVFCTYELGKLLVQDGLDESQIQFMNKGGGIELTKGLRATLTHAQHSSSYDSRDGNTYYAGEAAGIMLEFEQAQKRQCLYHLGDTALFSDLALYGQLYQPDLALIPIGDRFTMGPREAALAAKMCGAKKLLPIHHSTFGLLSGTVQEFEEELAKLGLDAELLTVKPGDKTLI